MAIPRFDEDLAIISKLGDNPGSDNNLTTDAFRAKFDEGPQKIQKFLNNVLIPAVAQRSPIVVGDVAPVSGPALWFNTAPNGAVNQAAMLMLEDDETGYGMQVDVGDETYGVKNATVNQGASAGNFDFTVL